MRLPDKIKYLLKGTFLERKEVVDYKSQYFELNPLVKSSKIVGNVYNIEMKDGCKLSLRGTDSSDFSVFKQIFILKEYDCVRSILELNKTVDEHIIIDAGANIGLTTLYFNRNINLRHSYLIEPDPGNFNFCLNNLEQNLKSNKYTLFNKALASEQNKNFKLNRDFRDGRDWSVVTEESIDGDIEGITLNSLIENCSLDFISLLKIDIEGFERFIFKIGNNLSFLTKVYIIAIEIHDEFNSRTEIEGLLLKNNFILLHSGELTIGINKRYAGVT